MLLDTVEAFDLSTNYDRHKAEMHGNLRFVRTEIEFVKYCIWQCIQITDSLLAACSFFCFVNSIVHETNVYEFVQYFIVFLSEKKRYRFLLSAHVPFFVINIRTPRTFWNSTHCLIIPFTLDWSYNLLNDPMWYMAVNNIP